MVRADRLLAELMLLQERIPVTAAELAERLEVSTRTVYRDMEALQMAGVPIVALAGPGGGFSLYGEWRTDVAGLSADELTALAVGMVAGPAADPAVAQHIRTAVMKVAASLPEAARRNVERLQRHIHVDPFPSSGSSRGPVGVIAAALQDGQCIHLVRRGPSGTKVSRTGLPLGLVIADSDWYVVWAPRGGPPRADRVGALLDVEGVAAPVAEPADFDVAAFWRSWRERDTERHSGLEAHLRVESGLLPLLRRRFESRMEVESEDPLVVCVRFESIYEARDEVLAWGGAAEVLEPKALRRTVADFAAQAARVYRS